jgi:hypothetical protein
MPPPTISEQAPAVNPPKHPLHALTSYELRDYRRQLENAIAYFDRQDPTPAVRDDLQTTLYAVTAEQESRTRLTHA